MPKRRLRMPFPISNPSPFRRVLRSYQYVRDPRRHGPGYQTKMSVKPQRRLDRSERRNILLPRLAESGRHGDGVCPAGRSVWLWVRKMGCRLSRGGIRSGGRCFFFGGLLLGATLANCAAISLSPKVVVWWVGHLCGAAHVISIVMAPQANAAVPVQSLTLMLGRQVKLSLDA